MTKEQIIERHPDNEDLIFLKGFDNAIMGTALSNGKLVVCYSIQKMVDSLKSDHDMSDSDAYEWLDYNTLFAYFGDHTPVYLEDYIEPV